MKHVAKTEARDLTRDFREEFEAAGVTGILWGTGGLLAAAGLTTLCVALGLKLSGLPVRGTVGVGLGLLGLSLGCVLQGWVVLPKQAMQELGAEVREDVAGELH